MIYYDFRTKTLTIDTGKNYLSYQPNIFREGNHMSRVSKTPVTFDLGYILVKI